MPRLTRKDIADLKSLLAQWQSPEAMSRLTSETMDKLGSTDFFNQGGLTILRDAWIASEFALIRQAAKVRLIADVWPDFELKIEGKIEAFEADNPQRRRGDEYRNRNGGIEHDPVENWITRAEQAPLWIETACKKKTNKLYGARTNLIIYLNLSEYGIRQNEVESTFASKTAIAKNNFDSVWILWKKQAYLVWNNGELATQFSQVANGRIG